MGSAFYEASGTDTALPRSQKTHACLSGDPMSKAGKKALAANIARTLRDGPGLRYSIRTAVVATCLATGRCLVTGLGGMGVGTMWFDFDERNWKRSGADVKNFATEAEADTWWWKELWDLKG